MNIRLSIFGHPTEVGKTRVPILEFTIPAQEGGVWYWDTDDCGFPMRITAQMRDAPVTSKTPLSLSDISEFDLLAELSRRAVERADREYWEKENAR